MEFLTEREEEFMRLIWKTGGGFVRDFLKIRKEGSEPVPYTTAASIVKNLETKKYVLGERIGNMIYYKPIVSKESYRKKTFKVLLKNYFSGSYKNLVASFIQEKELSPEELKEIINLIEKDN